MLKSGRAVKSTRVLQHIRWHSGHQAAPKPETSVAIDPKETWSKPGHPRPCRAVKSSFGPLGTTPLGLTMRRLP